MKSYTDIEQSKKLAKILPIESADMYWRSLNINGHISWSSHVRGLEPPIYDLEHYIPAWSLAALLDILSEKSHSIDEDGAVSLGSYKNIEWNCGLINVADLEASTSLNPVDACVEMIIKLNELKML